MRKVVRCTECGGTEKRHRRSCTLSSAFRRMSFWDAVLEVRSAQDAGKKLERWRRENKDD